MNSLIIPFGTSFVKGKWYLRKASWSSSGVFESRHIGARIWWSTRRMVLIVSHVESHSVCRMRYARNSASMSSKFVSHSLSTIESDMKFITMSFVSRSKRTHGVPSVFVPQ